MTRWPVTAQAGVHFVVIGAAVITVTALGVAAAVVGGVIAVCQAIDNDT